jgi:NhaP-type Na+/H+ and K+/H+ antiporter
LLLPLGLDQSAIAAFSICAMAGVLAASVKAPITSILLMAEMTGSLVHLLPVAAVAFLALLVSDLLRIRPIYEVLLERLGGEADARTAHRPGALVEFPVELNSVADGKRVREIAWPQGALIVSVRRGEREFVPNGNTVLRHGDYLVVLSGESCFSETRAALSELCSSN